MREATRNGDNGWGGYQWPGGVPYPLLATVTIPGGVKVVVRKELAELVALNYEIADRKYGRQFTRGWTGGYNNRPIANTTSPSNHSRARAIDNDAQDNPSSRTFVSNLPPGLVADWESTGWYWGGRYTGLFDPMHFEYIGTPGDVAGDVQQARRILSDLNRLEEKPAPAPPVPTPPVPTPPVPTPEPPPVDEDAMPFSGDEIRTMVVQAMLSKDGQAAIRKQVNDGVLEVSEQQNFVTLTNYERLGPQIQKWVSDETLKVIVAQGLSGAGDFNRLKTVLLPALVDALAAHGIASDATDQLADDVISKLAERLAT